MSRICQETDCTKNASFNYEGEKKRLYCITHKKRWHGKFNR